MGEDIEHARYKVSHVPCITAEKRGFGELILKDRQLRAQGLFCLNGQGLVPLLRRIENPISEQRYQRRFDFGGREERPLEHPASALRRRRIEGVLVGLGEIEVNCRSLPHDKAAVINSGHKSVRIQREIPRFFALRVRDAERYRNVFVGNAELVCEPDDAKRTGMRGSKNLEHAILLPDRIERLWSRFLSLPRHDFGVREAKQGVWIAAPDAPGGGHFL